MSANLIGKEKTIVVNGIKTNYHVAGKGDPVVLIHGAGPGATGLSNWSRNIAQLAKHFEVFTIDLPGFGKSDKMEIPSEFFEFYGNHVGLFLDALNIDKADLVGNSLGGGASMMLALRRPEKVRRMVLMGPGGGFPIYTVMPTTGLKKLVSFYEGDGPTREKVVEFVQELVFDTSVITDEIIEERLSAARAPDVLACPPFGLRDGKPPVPSAVWRERLDLLEHKTLIVWGREDRVMPVDNAVVLAKQIPNASLHILPNCGHWAQWEKADQFNSLVETFFNE